MRTILIQVDTDAHPSSFDRVVAIDAGVDLPGDWPDPLRTKDAGKPDLGALPLGAEPFPVDPNAGS